MAEHLDEALCLSLDGDLYLVAFSARVLTKICIRSLYLQTNTPLC